MGIIEPRSTEATFLHCLYDQSYHTIWNLSGLKGKDFASDPQVLLLIESSGVSPLTSMLTRDLSPTPVCSLFSQDINKAPFITEKQIIYHRHVPLRKP